MPKGTVTVTALGDSVPSGFACHCTTYVQRVGTALGHELGKVPVVHNLAVGGLTSADLRGSLTEPAVRRSLAAADLTLVEVGANDFDESDVSDPSCEPAATSSCYSATLTRLRANVRRIVETAQADQQTPGAQVAVLSYWNVFKDGAVGRARGEAYVAGSDDLTRVVNGVLREVADQEGAIYVDAYSPFKGTGGRDATGDLAADGDHPNSSGHRLLARAVLAALQDVFVTPSPGTAAP
jgi:lysophospholipase L1-like esterase